MPNTAMKHSFSCAVAKWSTCIVAASGIGVGLGFAGLAVAATRTGVIGTLDGTLYCFAPKLKNGDSAS